jgi:4-hydroxy-4-methyl-2-oxoglutarate aldolase
VIQRFPTSTLADVVGAECALARRIRPLVAGAAFAGTALPVSAAGGDNGPVARAVAVAEPGDVLVIDGGGLDAVALFGGVMTRRALSRGVAGVVVDGCARDLDELVELGLPVYAIGVTPVPPSKVDLRDPVEVVTCGDREIRRGDVVTADGDGVVVIAAADWDRIAVAATEAMEREAEVVRGIA